jgi:uncharacterized protein (TIGR01777 family)
MKVLVAGGTGFIGRALVEALRARGDEVWVLSRSPKREGEIGYDNLPERADVIVNFAGEWVVGLWTPAKKRKILQSRIEITRKLVSWMLDTADHMPVLVNASAIGFYGNRPGEVLTEQSAYDPNDAFRGRVCRAWEAETRPASEAGARVVLARLSGILDPSGGLIALFLPVMRIAPFLIPPAAKTMLSWISLDDTVRMLLLAIDNPQVSGPMNVSNERAVTYGELVRKLGRVLGKKTFGTIPPWLLRILLWENSEAFTDWQDVRPQVALDQGFTFLHPTLDDWIAAHLPELRRR